jgi:hypothetical protein
MSTADGLFFVAAFTIVIVLQSSIRDRLKRIEKKIDTLGK